MSGNVQEYIQASHVLSIGKQKYTHFKLHNIPFDIDVHAAHLRAFRPEFPPAEQELPLLALAEVLGLFEVLGLVEVLALVEVVPLPAGASLPPYPVAIGGPGMG